MQNKYKLYISGGMSGYPEFNYPMFKRANELACRLGWLPLDPSDNFGGNPNHPGGRRAYMKLDFQKVMSSQGIGFLPNWEKSRGARAEAIVAYELELDFWLFNEDITDITQVDQSTIGQKIGIVSPPYETVCAKADRLVSTERGSAYGHPLDDFTRTGKIWGAILGIPAVPPELVGLCMIGVKVSREVNTHKQDNDTLTDICGYAKTIEMVHHERKRLRSFYDTGSFG